MQLYGGVSNKLLKNGGGVKPKLLIFQNFTNGLASQIVKSASHNLMILLQC